MGPEIYTHSKEGYRKFQRGRGSDCQKPYFWEVASFGVHLMTLSKAYGSCLKVIMTVAQSDDDVMCYEESDSCCWL